MRPCERVNKFWLMASVASVALLYILFSIYCDLRIDTWRTSRINFMTDDANLNPSDLNETTKKLLFWNTMFGDETFYFGKGDIFKDCPGDTRNCWATHDRGLVDVDDFDAILFHGSNIEGVSDVPKVRREGQIYFFVNLESPENRPILFTEFDYSYFNATMTYRLDSDVVWPYADVRTVHDGSLVAPKGDVAWSTRLYEATGPQSTGKSYGGSGEMHLWRDQSKTSSTTKKTKTAAWIVSNCHTKSKREKYVDELARHVDIDIFGWCGKSICPKGQDCFRELVEPNYYFYLSFENSMCQDYVTEKLFNALKYRVVPVVYGGANYSRFAPPKSYINALDFDSPKKLAEYLKSLIRKPKEYEMYFEWKRYYKVVSSNSRVICELCRYLHQNNTTKTYSPLSAWYQSDKCPLQDKLQYLPYLTKEELKSR